MPTMSDEEVRQDRWEQLHGPIMEWTYGCYPPKNAPAGAENVHEDAETYRDAVAALHNLIQAGGDEAVDCALDFPGHEDVDGLWQTFADQLDTVTSQRPFREVSLVGPDGWTYWITRYEH